MQNGQNNKSCCQPVLQNVVQPDHGIWIVQQVPNWSTAMTAAHGVVESIELA